LVFVIDRVIVIALTGVSGAWGGPRELDEARSGLQATRATSLHPGPPGVASFAFGFGFGLCAGCVLELELQLQLELGLNLQDPSAGL